MLVAHAGHWIVWALYALPVIAVLVVLGLSALRSRREERAGEGENRMTDDRPGRGGARPD